MAIAATRAAIQRELSGNFREICVGNFWWPVCVIPDDQCGNTIGQFRTGPCANTVRSWSAIRCDPGRQLGTIRARNSAGKFVEKHMGADDLLSAKVRGMIAESHHFRALQRVALSTRHSFADIGADGGYGLSSAV